MSETVLMSLMSLNGCPSLWDTRREWIRLGGTVEELRRTGEWRFSHSKIARPLTVNARRRDTPRVLLVALRRLAKLEKGEERDS